MVYYYVKQFCVVLPSTLSNPAKDPYPKRVGYRVSADVSGKNWM